MSSVTPTRNESLSSLERGMAVIQVISFFFSGRRRHTRYWRDWSSDVCSSDLSAGDRLGERAGELLVDLNPLGLDRKSTRLNSSHANISYAVFCLKKKKKTK